MTHASYQKPVIFLAPGSGLGHLVRTGGLCLELEHRSIPTLILTTSALGLGFSKLTGLTVIPIPAFRWKQELVDRVRDLQPAVLIQDVFHLGLYGEDLTGIGRDQPWILLCRRLRFSRYLETLASRGAFRPPDYDTALITEPLSKNHQGWVESHAQSIISLEKPVCFPCDKIRLPRIPAPLEKDLSNKDLHLIVHSGPKAEIERLVAYAKTAIKKKGKGEIAIINPRMAASGLSRCYDYFPAAALYPRATHIYTGAGYNAMAETAPFCNKHTAIAFDRNYDDQHWRLTHDFSSTLSTNRTALTVIENHYNLASKG